MNRILFLIICLMAPFSTISAYADPLSDRLRSIVEINSGTANLSGVKRVQEWFSAELQKLGFSAKLDENGLLVATISGVDSSKPITLLVHVDTVFEPSSTFQEWKLSSDGKQAIGPGVIDAKGGIVIILEGLKRFLADHPKPTFSIRVVSSPAEETGSTPFLETFRVLALDSRIVLGFEPALEDGAIIGSRRGDRWYHVKVVGKESHAGRAHGEGANACVELSAKLAKISWLTDYKRNLTVSVGHIEGGKDKYNIVCGSAEAKIDTRFATIADRDVLHRKISKILKDPFVKGTQTTFELADDCPPFSPSKTSASPIKAYLKAIQMSETKSPISKASGGASDANYFSREGLPVIDGLGAVGGKMHTAEEYVVLSSLETRAAALGEFLKSVH